MKNLNESWDDMTLGTYLAIQNVLDKPEHSEIKMKTKLDNNYAFKLLCELYSPNKGYTSNIAINIDDLLHSGRETLIGIKKLEGTGLIDKNSGYFILSSKGYKFFIDLEVQLKTQLNRDLESYRRIN